MTSELKWRLVRRKGMPQPYVSVTLKCADQILFWMRGKPAWWSVSSGHLCHIMPKGHGSEAGSHFPDWAWRRACAASNWWRLRVALLLRRYR